MPFNMMVVATSGRATMFVTSTPRPLIHEDDDDGSPHDYSTVWYLSFMPKTPAKDKISEISLLIGIKGLIRSVYGWDMRICRFPYSEPRAAPGRRGSDNMGCVD